MEAHPPSSAASRAAMASGFAVLKELMEVSVGEDEKGKNLKKPTFVGKHLAGPAIPAHDDEMARLFRARI
jgi:hypothetical protein